MTLTVMGTVLLSKPQSAKSGWRMRLCGDLLWLMWGHQIGYPSAMVNAALFVIVDLIGMRRLVPAQKVRTVSMSGVMSRPSENDAIPGVPDVDTVLPQYRTTPSSKDS